VAVLFPNDSSELRLATAVLMEIHEEWIAGREYIDMEELGSSNTTKESKRLAI